MSPITMYTTPRATNPRRAQRSAHGLSEARRAERWTWSIVVVAAGIAMPLPAEALVRNPRWSAQPSAVARRSSAPRVRVPHQRRSRPSTKRTSAAAGSSSASVALREGVRLARRHHQVGPAPLGRRRDPPPGRRPRRRPRWPPRGPAAPRSRRWARRAPSTGRFQIGTHARRGRRRFRPSADGLPRRPHGRRQRRPSGRRARPGRARRARGRRGQPRRARRGPRGGSPPRRAPPGRARARRCPSTSGSFVPPTWREVGLLAEPRARRPDGCPTPGASPSPTAPGSRRGERPRPALRRTAPRSPRRTWRGCHGA